MIFNPNTHFTFFYGKSPHFVAYFIENNTKLKLNSTKNVSKKSYCLNSRSYIFKTLLLMGLFKNF